MGVRWILLGLLTLAMTQPSPAAGQRASDGKRKPDEKRFPNVDKNHVRKTSADNLGSFRRITWHYDFETAAALARDTRRPMFVIFCRAGTLTDPTSGKPKCAS